jgi:hypothetical protein
VSSAANTPEHKLGEDKIMQDAGTHGAIPAAIAAARGAIAAAIAAIAAAEASNVTIIPELRLGEDKIREDTGTRAVVQGHQNVVDIVKGHLWDACST